jgi:hypothetical protein
MRLREFVAEAETGTTRSREIDRRLGELGYKKLGQGADATVYAKDSSHVIKILMPEDPSTRSEQVFNRFYEFCREHSNVRCLPVFNEVNAIEIGGQEYLQIDMERLEPVPSGSVKEAMVWLLSDLATGKLNWPAVKNQLMDPQSWSDYTGELDAQDIIGAVRAMRPAELQAYQQLYKVMTLLYHTGRINKIGWDLHTENVMQRSNGELVIIDPWFAINDGL